MTDLKKIAVEMFVDCVMLGDKFEYSKVDNTVSIDHTIYTINCSVTEVIEEFKRRLQNAGEDEYDGK